jgi:hypothetical protein
MQRVFTLTLALLLAAGSARADDESLLRRVEPPEIHAFVSQGFVKTTNNNYLTHSERGSFEFTEVGLNVTQNLTDGLRLGVQLFAQDLGPSGNYAPRFDWYYLDWRFENWLGVRVGRTKIPFGLYNDSADFDAARVPVLLPQSVYPIDHREYLLAHTGGELYGNVPIGALGGLEYRLYGGTLAVSDPAPPGPGVTIHDVDVRHVAGGRLSWLPPLPGLTVAGSFQTLRIDWKYQIDPALIVPLQAAMLLPTPFDGTLPVEFTVKLWVASLEYQTGGLLLASEYSRWTGAFESRAPALLPKRVVNERYYAMVSYQVAPWFTPGAYYSVYYPNIHQRRGPAAYARDAALSFRYDISENWLLKLEGHWMEGTAALEDASLNDGKAPKDLVKEWGMLLVKTTAYF